MHRKHPIELRVPSKADLPSPQLSSYQSASVLRVAEAETSPRASDTYISLAQKTESDDVKTLVATLRNDKQALKDALRTAIGKRDELSARLQTAQSAASQEAKRSQMCMLEASHSQQIVARLSQELDEQRSRIDQLTTDRDMLLRENEALKAELDRVRQPTDSKRRHLRTGSEVTAKNADLQHEIGKYGNFVVAKLGQVPELQALFRGRAYSTKYFQDVIHKGTYMEGFLTMLQFISDILVFETHKRGTNSSPKGMDGGSFVFQTSRTSSHRADADSSSQQSDSSNKPIPPLVMPQELVREDSPLFLTKGRKFSKESRSAGSSPKRGVTSRQKEPTTPSLGKSKKSFDADGRKG